MQLTCDVFSSFITVGKCCYSAFTGSAFSSISTLLSSKNVCFAVYFKHVLFARICFLSITVAENLNAGCVSLQVLVGISDVLIWLHVNPVNPTVRVNCSLILIL